MADTFSILTAPVREAHPHFISVLDGITEIVLENIKLTSGNAHDLSPFLQHIRRSYGDPVALELEELIEALEVPREA